MGDATNLIFKAMRSGRFFRNHKGSRPEYIPLIGPPLSDDEGAKWTPPRSVVQLITQGIPRINHPSTPDPRWPGPSHNHLFVQ